MLRLAKPTHDERDRIQDQPTANCYLPMDLKCLLESTTPIWHSQIVYQHSWTWRWRGWEHADWRFVHVHTLMPLAAVHTAKSHRTKPLFLLPPSPQVRFLDQSPERTFSQFPCPPNKDPTQCLSVARNSSFSFECSCSSLYINTFQSLNLLNLDDLSYSLQTI